MKNKPKLKPNEQRMWAVFVKPEMPIPGMMLFLTRKEAERWAHRPYGEIVRSVVVRIED